MKHKRDESKPGFVFNHYGEGREYFHTEIRIIPDPGSSFNRQEITIKWQSNRDSEWDLCGQRCEYEFETPEQLATLNRLFKQLFGHLDKPWNGDGPRPPGFCVVPILMALHESKLVNQVVYDSRVSEYLTLDDVQPPNFRAYRDDYEAVRYGDNWSGCTVGCMAPDEEEAQRLLTIEFATNVSERRSGRFKKWLEAGRPVMQLRNGYEAPEPFPVEKAIAAIVAAQEERERKEKEGREQEQKQHEEVTA